MVVCLSTQWLQHKNMESKDTYKNTHTKNQKQPMLQISYMTLTPADFIKKAVEKPWFVKLNSWNYPY